MAFTIAFGLVFMFSSVLVHSSVANTPSNAPIKVWIYLDESKLTPANTRPVALHEKILKRLSVKGTGSSDYLSNSKPDDSLHNQIATHVVKIVQYSRSLRAYSAYASPSQIQELQELAFVKQVQPVRIYKRSHPVGKIELSSILAKTMLDTNVYGNSFNQLAQLNIPTVHDSGYTGKGVRIAVIDAGFYKDHPVFQHLINDGRLIAERDFVFNDDNVQDEIPEDTTSGGAQSNHGTSVWSVVGGYVPYTYIGAAYGAEFLLAKTERIGSESIIEEDRFVAAVEWADSLGTDIISSSVAYRDFDNSDDDYFFEDLDGKTTASARAINWAFDRGILSTITAGNYAQYYSDGGLHTPTDAYGALSCGAVDLQGIIASFSSHGPTADGRIKPDLCARGVGTYTAYASLDYPYSNRSGTSFSTPLIAGAAALVMEKHPELSPAQITARLKQYASYADFPDNRYGWGIPDVYRSVFETGLTTEDGVVHSYPNPSIQSVSFQFHWTNIKPSNINTPFKIYNLLGELVWRTTLAPKSAGIGELVPWNLKNINGGIVPSGVYIVAVKDGHTTIRGKFLVLH